MQRIKGIFKASREREDEFALLGKKNILALGAGFLTATVKLVETCVKVLGVHHWNVEFCHHNVHQLRK